MRAEGNKKCISAGCTNEVKHRNHSRCSPCINNLHKYGMTIPQRTEMWEAANCRCEICNKPVEFIDSRHKGDRNTWAVVDHCHTTDDVRGILCHKCNLGLGHFDDDIERMKSAIKYLRR